MRGLLRLKDGNIDLLTDSCGDRPLVFTDDVDVAADGTIWFSDASERFSVEDWRLDIMESRPNGRLCSFDPTTGKTQERLAPLYFANGVAIDPEQRFVLVNETSRYRVRRYWLTGPNAGKDDLLIDNLPGFPDGISAGQDGVFWLALAAPRNVWLDYLAPFPFIRSIVTRLPEALQPSPKNTLEIVGLAATGEVLHHHLHRADSPLKMATSVQQDGHFLYVGSLKSPAWARLKAP